MERCHDCKCYCIYCNRLKSYSQPCFPPTGLNQCEMSCVLVLKSVVHKRKKKKKSLLSRLGAAKTDETLVPFLFGRGVFRYLTVSKIPSPTLLNPAGASSAQVFSDSTNFQQFIARKHSLYILPSPWDICLMNYNGLMNCDVTSWYLIL